MAASVDSLAKGRRDLLVALKARGPLTIRALARHARLSLEAVRKTLRDLETAGWVARAPAGDPGVRGRGRPAARYALTALGEEAFPKAYADLAIALVDAVATTLGPAALQRVLASVTDARVAALAPLVVDRPLEGRLAATRAIYRERDAHLSVRRTGDTWRIEERNCPFLAVAMGRPALCSTTVSTLSRLLGVRVVRERRFQRGDGRCVFRVDASLPRPADAPGFEPEPEA